jgi:daunorubicin resistance ABC transporter ATP-binding subunit/daunorubicin resistance ABC transporter membrane protein
MMSSIWADHLVKRFGTTVAVDGISLAVETGECFGFLGPNGAGKTTTVNLFCTLLRPTAGQARVDGFDIAGQAEQVRRRIGLVAQDPSLDYWLTAWENLDLHARIYGLPRRRWMARAEHLLRLVDLWDRRHELVRTFSGGMRRRLEVVRSLLHQPRVLFLDEPTSGLDPRTREQIWAHLLGLREREGVTLFLTTHHLAEAEHCDRIAIIDRGRLVALDTPDRLRALAGGDRLTIRTTEVEAAVANLWSRFGLSAGAGAGCLRLEVADAAHLIPRLVAGLGVPIEAVAVERPTLEDAYLKLTAGGGPAENGRPARPGGVPPARAGQAVAPAMPAAASGPRPPPGRRLAAPPAAGLGAVAALWRRDVVRLARDRGQLAASLGQALLVLAVFGAGLPSALTPPSARPSELGYAQFVFPGVLVAAVFVPAVASAMSVVWDRGFGFLKEVLVAPAPAWAVALGKTLGGGTTATLQALPLLLCAPVAGIPLTLPVIAAGLPILFLTALVLSALGLLIAGWMKTMESFQAVMSLVLMPLFVLSGALFPISALPGWLAAVTRLNPVSYSVDALRQVLLREAGVPPALVEPLRLTLGDRPLSVGADLALVTGCALLVTVLAGRGVRAGR